MKASFLTIRDISFIFLHLYLFKIFEGELGEPDCGAEGPDPQPAAAALLPGYPGHLRGDAGGRPAGGRQVQTRGLQVGRVFA